MGLWGYPMFVAGVDAYSKASLEGLDCQEGSGRLVRFRGAGSLLYHLGAQTIGRFEPPTLWVMSHQHFR
jgi:hypothetical protein